MTAIERTKSAALVPTRVIPDAPVLERAAGAMEKSLFQPWRGCGGEVVPGAEVVRHLEGTLAVMDAEGWVREYEDDGLDVDDSASVPAMLRALVRFFRGPTGVTLWDALYSVEDSDRDTAMVAREVLDAVLEARLGATSANSSAWAERRDRTESEVRELVHAGIALAGQYGPKAGA